MKAHRDHLINRIIRAGLRVTCTYKVVAVGFDRRGKPIGLATNTHRFERGRGFHAEERLIHRLPRNLARIQIARINKKGQFLPIDPCHNCQRLANKHNIVIDKLEV